VKTDGRKKAKNSQPEHNSPVKSPPPPRAARDVEAPIKLRHLAVLLGLGIALLALLSFVLESYWERKQPVFQDAPKLVRALQAYSRDRFVHGQGLPSAVSLSDLVVGRYLTTNEVRAFDGIEVTISTTANSTNAQGILIHARLPDGTSVELLGDGSVQMLRK
jgi:hypothetical protein